MPAQPRMADAIDQHEPDEAPSEMCVMVLWAWPIGQLQNDLPLGSKYGLAEDTDCMEP